MEEVWKNISGYEDYYMVSNYGRIKSKDRVLRNNNGFYTKKGRILKLFDNGLGYMFVYLKNNSSKKYYVHRLVAQEFILNSQNLPYVNHKDCNPKNNCVDNLEWCTPQENTQYMFKMNRQNRNNGWYEKQLIYHNQQSKKVKQLDDNGNLIRIYPKIKETKKYGFDPAGVCECCKGKRTHHHGFIWRYANEG